MASFRDKLRRFDADQKARASTEEVAAPAVAPPNAPSADGLDALRARLGVITGQAAPQHTAQRPLTAFRREPAGEGGDRWVLRMRCGAERVGTVPLGAMEAADMKMLSMLGLTPTIADLRPEDALFIDTETTGLAGGTGTVAFLVGLAWYDRGAWVVEQLLLREMGDEAVLLERVCQLIERCSWLVSYNGKSFDIPLLRSRLVMSRLPPLPERPHLDLLHLVRRVHRAREWKKSLTSAELHVLSYDRGPDVAGADVAERYLHYLRSGDDRGLADVVEHNLDDVRSMVALAGLYGEPSSYLPGIDLAHAARVVKRAGAMEEAAGVAELAMARGAGEHGLLARAQIAKARGDKAQALADFEVLAEQIDDAAVRLELAKLYEHYAKRPARALAVAQEGTGEKPTDEQRRVARLERKLGRERDHDTEADEPTRR